MSGVLSQFSSPLGHVRGSGLHPHLQELKEEMRKLDLDWANYLRTTIEEKIGTERMTRACTTMDQLREKTRGFKFDSVKTIREARNSR